MIYLEEINQNSILIKIIDKNNEQKCVIHQSSYPIFCHISEVFVTWDGLCKFLRVGERIMVLLWEQNERIKIKVSPII